MQPDREQCHHWCSCTDTHWVREDGRDVWRPGAGDCSHPRRDGPGPVWGLAAAPPDPVVWRVSGGRGWVWVVVRGGVLAEYGWADTARWALHTAEGVAHGLECGLVRRDSAARRCDLVAAEGWRWLVERERRGDAA